MKEITRYPRKWHYDQEGQFHDDTPICKHRNKKAEQGSLDTFKCKARTEVVHCCGQCVSCSSYEPTPEVKQLSLFNEK